MTNLTMRDDITIWKKRITVELVFSTKALLKCALALKGVQWHHLSAKEKIAVMNELRPKMREVKQA